jgi:hypothetical protein
MPYVTDSAFRQHHDALYFNEGDKALPGKQRQGVVTSEVLMRMTGDLDTMDAILAVAITRQIGEEPRPDHLRDAAREWVFQPAPQPKRRRRRQAEG